MQGSFLKLPPHDLDLLPAVRQDWQIRIEAWEDQRDPDPNPEKWECRYCPYQAICEI
jgi:hypothetical protein